MNNFMKKLLVLMTLLSIGLAIPSYAAKELDADHNQAIDINNGGTNARNAADARANLGVQAANSNLDVLSTGTVLAKQALIQAMPESIATIAALKTTNGVSNGAIRYVRGYYADSDGGQGAFVWNSTSTDADNGGTILAVTGVSTGRWFRIYTGAIHVEWFGVDNGGVIDVYDKIQAIIDLIPTGGIIEFEPNASYNISSNGTGITFDRKIGIRFNNCTFNYSGDLFAVRIGSGPSTPRFYSSWVEGPVSVIRTAAIDHTGTKTAASQLKGNGIEFNGIQDFDFSGGAYVNGFYAGYAFVGNTSLLNLHNFQTQDCLIDFMFDPNQYDSWANNFVTAINFYGGNITFNSAFYSDVTGSMGVAIWKDNPIDGINFYGTALEANSKYRKLYCQASECSFNDCYWDYHTTAPGGVDFEFSGSSFRNKIAGGSTLISHTIIDNGLYNSIGDPASFWIDGVTRTPHFGSGIGADIGLIVRTQDALLDGSYEDIPAAKNGFITASLSKEESNVGSGTTQWDITNISGSTYRYTWTGSGTNPDLTSSSHRGTIVIAGGSFASGNTGSFQITGTGTNYFEISNASGVAESGKTGTVTWYILESGNWVFDINGKIKLVSGTQGTSAELGKDGVLSCGASGGKIFIYNRMKATCKLKVTAWCR